MEEITEEVFHKYSRDKHEGTYRSGEWGEDLAQ